MGVHSTRYKETVRPEHPFAPYNRSRNPLSVLIIGNGFDLDLGMHTSYRDFANSNFWPFDKPIYGKGLGEFLNKIKETERWLDLENELANYAQSISPETLINEQLISEDKVDFKVLSISLKDFLKAEQDNFYKEKDSISIQILRNLKHNLNYFIHSFNYTDIKYIASRLGIHLSQNKIEYIHGSLADDDIILGTGDNTDLPEGYDFLYKTFNRNYSSNNLAESLNYAQEITIFGHSLGDNDFDYFKPFFQKISQNVGVNFNHLTNERLKLTIYTRDEESEIEIKRQLRKLTDNHLQAIYANCDFEIKYTQP